MHILDPISRVEFVSRIPQGTCTLEIGPFAFPTLKGASVRYFDVLDEQQIKDECDRLKLPKSEVPEKIDYVARDIALGDIPSTFGQVFSSHVIEHTPDIYGHLRQVAQLLRNGGSYWLAIPDKRYCFDHFKTVSTVGEAIAAYREQRTAAPIDLWIERYTHGSHNDAARHWAGDHGQFPKSTDLSKVITALKEYSNVDNEAKMAPHLWFFQPETFADIVDIGYRLGITELSLKFIFGTLKGCSEFYAVLQKSSFGADK